MLSDKDTICLGFKNSHSVLSLLFSSFYSFYDSKIHVLRCISNDDSMPMLDRYICTYKNKVINCGYTIEYNKFKNLNNEDQKAFIWFIQNLE